MQPLIQLTDVSVTFNGVPALQHVNLTVRRGEHLLILGRNGAGKSTLLRLLRGEIYPDQKDGGEVRWFETNAQAASQTVASGDSASESFSDCGDTTPLSGHAMTAIVSPKLQDYYSRQAWNVNAMEVILAAKTDDYILYREPDAAEQQEVCALAALLHAEHLLDRKISTFSQGQMRLVLVLRALIRKSPILLLDEVLCGLDASGKAAVMDSLTALAATEKSPTLIMVKHRIPLPSFIKKIIHMDHGILSEESCAEADKKSSGKAISGQGSTPVVKLPDFLAAPRTGLHISLQNASVYIDHQEILHGITWDIAPTQQWAVLGHNGAGKSTLLLTLLGVYPVAVGGSLSRTMTEAGQTHLLTELAEIQKNIGFVSDALQTHYTYNDSVEKIVFCGIDGHVGVHRDILPEERTRVEQMLEFLDLTSLRQRPLHSLSSGQARRVMLARALMSHPRMILLDEPFSGLDAEARAFMGAVLAQCIQAGLQTVTVSHHPEDFPADATHYAELEDGRLHIA